MVILKQTFTIFLLFFILVNINGCFMMPLMLTSINDWDSRKNDESAIEVLATELIEQSADDIKLQNKWHEQFLISKVEVQSEVIANGKIEEILIEALHKRNIWKDLKEANKVAKVSPYQNVLLTQLSKSDGELLLTHQMVDLRTNKTIWYGSYSSLIAKKSQWQKLGSIFKP